MAINMINPDAAILQQVQEHWQKLAALIVWKLAPNGVTLTHEDIASFPPDRILLTHGHRDSIEFKIISQADAERVAAHDQQTNRGRA